MNFLLNAPPMVPYCRLQGLQLGATLHRCFAPFVPRTSLGGVEEHYIYLATALCSWPLDPCFPPQIAPSLVPQPKAPLPCLLIYGSNDPLSFGTSDAQRLERGAGPMFLCSLSILGM